MPIPFGPSWAMALTFWSVAGEEFTGFDGSPAGEVDRVETEVGTLVAAVGHAQISRQHAHSGSQCLRLHGGEERQVELFLAGGPRDVAEIRFRAERWTSRNPFSFRVEVHEEDGWREAYDGTSEVKVGARFLSTVQFAVQSEIDRVRFLCTAPEGAGLLIDDLEILIPSPVRLERAECFRPTLPILIGNLWSPVSSLNLDVEGTEGAIELSRVVVDLEGTSDFGTLDQVALFAGPGRLDHRDPRAQFGKTNRIGPPQPAVAGPITFSEGVTLDRGTNSFWICVSLSETPDLDARVRASVREIEVGGEIRSVNEAPEASSSEPQRLGVALRSKGDDGSEAFRIPGLVTTPAGTLLAVYDIRWKGWGDLPGDLDVGMSRSTDRGVTWEAQRILLDRGGDGEGAWRGDGVGDPAVLVDRETGSVFVIAAWSHGDRAWHGSGPGLDPEETGQLLLVRSDDDGRTWSEPRNLTPMVKDPSWSYLLQGPGRGISMRDGTLVFPAQFQAAPEEGRVPFSTIFVSRDHGETWTIGTGVKAGTTESAVIELEDGALMLNMRDNRGGSRSVFTTRDLGHTWKEHPSSRKSLIEPVCMASLIHVGRELSGAADGRLLFSNPNVSSAPRRRMTIQASGDYGVSWMAGSVLLDEGNSAGYSCLTMIDAETVGILYEGNRAHLTFQRIPLAELFPADDSAEEH